MSWIGMMGEQVREWVPYTHWDSHEDYTVEDWKCEVVEDNTRLGYHDWVRHRLEAEND